MKTIIYLINILWVTVPLFAQQSKVIKNSEVEGFFLTVSDFTSNKITFPTDMKHKGDKIRLNTFFPSDFITVFENGVKIKYAKDSIFAVKDKSNNTYRFINRNPSKIVDTTFLYIYEYKTTKTVHVSEGPKRSSTKYIPVTQYYFSYKTHKQVYLLTMNNIRNFVLNDIPQVHTQICSKFTNDKFLAEISTKTGFFTINDSFKEFLKK